MTTPISAVIITYNEEKNIGRCIHSLDGVVDEVVVVDSLSTDETVNIAKNLGAKVYSQAFLGYVQQKNFALSKSTYPHVLSLDADEALSGKLKQSILEVKSNWTHDGYYFNRLASYCGKWIRHTSWYPSKKLRLWDKRKGEWGGIDPHDKFFLKKGATRKFLKGDLLHYSFDTIDQHIQKVNLFSRLFAEAHFIKGRQANGFNLFFNPVWRFFRDYFIKLGIVDGVDGLTICAISSYETFLKYRKLIYLQRLNKKTRGEICFINGSATPGTEVNEYYEMVRQYMEEGKSLIVIANKRSDLLLRFRKNKIPAHFLGMAHYSYLNPFKILKLVFLFRRAGVSTLVIYSSLEARIARIAAKFAGVKHIILQPEKTILQNSNMLSSKSASQIKNNGFDLHENIELNELQDKKNESNNLIS